MGKPELLYMLIELIALCIPIGVIIYKLGRSGEKLNEHERRIKQCEQRETDIDNATEQSLNTIMSMLNDIKISIARLEERVSNKKNKKESEQ